MSNAEAQRQKQLAKDETRSKKDLKKVSLNLMVLKDITILGKPRPAKPSSRRGESSPSRSDKENTGNLYNSKQSARDYLSGTYSERSRAGGENVLKEKALNSPRSNANRDDAEGELSRLREELAAKEQEIAELNQILLEQNEELRQTFRSQGVTNGEEAEELEEGRLSRVSDLSIDSEEIMTANPAKLNKIVKSLRLEEHVLTQNIIELRSQSDALEEEKRVLEGQCEELKKDLKNLQKKSEGNKPKSFNTPEKKKKNSYTEREKGNKDGQVVRSDGEEDFTHYFVLKRKFDEIHAFITRIAGLLSKSLQISRGRHATPELKSTYGKSGGESITNIRGWLQASPSKTQVDKESRRFYLKFKKRFDASRIFIM